MATRLGRAAQRERHHTDGPQPCKKPSPSHVFVFSLLSCVVKMPKRPNLGMIVSEWAPGRPAPLQSGGCPLAALSPRGGGRPGRSRGQNVTLAAPALGAASVSSVATDYTLPRFALRSQQAHRSPLGVGCPHAASAHILCPYPLPTSSAHTTSSARTTSSAHILCTRSAKRIFGRRGVASQAATIGLAPLSLPFGRGGAPPGAQSGYL